MAISMPYCAIIQSRGFSVGDNVFMSKQFKTALILLFGIFVGVSASLTGNVLANKTDENSGLALDQLRNFSDIFSRIKSDYVEEIDDKTLLEHAIRGMLSGLDPHSSYLDADEYKELRIGTTGQFGGLGIQVSMDGGFVKVISPIDDTPAFEAGIEAGDLIIRLDQTSVKGLSLNEAVKIMRGTPGTEIELTIIREGESKPLSIKVIRDIIKVKSVKSRMLDPGYGYVRISNFQSRTGPHLLEAINKLKKENEGELNGLVIDLRNNPGGVLNAAAEVSDMFLNKGKLVYTEGRLENSHFEFNAKPGDVLDGAPVVVLINGGSASASEIVAGALQDHNRAVVMGTKSFGKGSVQTIQELRSGGAVKITTARYFTPSGRSIQGEGITPDIIIEKVKISHIDDDALARIKEADLKGTLSNPDNTLSVTETADTDNKDSAADKKQNLVFEDYALHEALSLLKGLTILRHRS